ncbi:MAG: SDR family oxidoreductase [Saprospiraceae bacterium]
MGSLKNKVAIVTGGNGVLGFAIACHISSLGATVYILGRNEEKTNLKIEEAQKSGITLLKLIADVSDEVSMQKACDLVLQKSGKIDILINGAGGNKRGATIMPDDSFFDISIEDFAGIMQLNLTGTVVACKVFGKNMADNKRGCIVNISSMAASLPLTRVVGYSASKAGIDNFTRWLAVEMANKYSPNIRVNAIAPGFFIADQNRALLLNEDGSLTARGNTIISQTPQKTFGKPSDLLSTIEWLCLDQSAFVTGIIVPIDGGFSAFSGV